jgi:hypothetical protein
MVPDELPLDKAFLAFLVGMLAFRAIDLASYKRKIDQALQRARRRLPSPPPGNGFPVVIPRLFILAGLIRRRGERARRAEAVARLRVSLSVRIARPVASSGGTRRETREFVPSYLRISYISEEYDFLMGAILLIFFLVLGFVIMHTDNPDPKGAQALLWRHEIILTAANLVVALLVACISYACESFRLKLERAMP